MIISLLAVSTSFELDNSMMHSRNIGELEGNENDNLDENDK